MANYLRYLMVGLALAAPLAGCRNLPDHPAASADLDPFNPAVTGENGSTGDVQVPVFGH